MSVTIGGTSGLVFPDASTQNTAATGFGFKNRIINGAMTIDQRNAGAASTPNDAYCLDRWWGRSTSGGVLTVQQSTTAPAGFYNSMKITISTADASIGSTDKYSIVQRIEGYNVTDLNYGASTAVTTTLSFWVRSSVTGNFSGAYSNDNADRSYPFTYTILAADTWEYKTVTIPGDTTGTWLKTNGVGLNVWFDMGSGANYRGTSDAWAAADYRAATGTVQLISTLNATFYITGVQLEKGSTATSFDYRPYGTELALCQRYYQITTVTTVQGVTSTNYYGAGGNYTVTPRTAPTLTYLSSSASYLFPSTAGTPNPVTINGFSYYKAANGSAGGGQFMDNLSLSAEL